MTIPKPTPPAAPLEFIAPPTSDADDATPLPEDLDGAAAWAEITALRGESRELKARIVALRAETADAESSIEAAKASIAELQEARVKAEAEHAEALIPYLRRAAFHRAARRFPVLVPLFDDLDDLLVGDDEATVLASAERLAGALTRTSTPSASPTIPAPSVVRRPAN
ncbi:hypothetical protein [Agromyces sp. CCNWLW203]|uniref:hypothetical protein n=1 Tax=Agromyces sp. CCNWLW203 TaxID=3112842 RepID=UPI002F967E64